MGDYADMIIDAWCYWGSDEDLWWPGEPPEPTPGVARPEMLIVDPTDFKDCS